LLYVVVLDYINFTYTNITTKIQQVTL